MKNETIQKIKSYYVGDDCVEVFVPYKKAITIFNPNGITYHSAEGSDNYINKYLEDERRTSFPYSNIPTHYEKTKKFNKLNYANQLFDFEKPYIRINDGFISESFAVKDKDEALLVNKLLTGDTRTIYLTRKELEQMLKQPTETDSKLYFLPGTTGHIYDSNVLELLSEEEIKEFLGKEFLKQYENYMIDKDCCSVNYFGDYHLQYIKQNIDNIKSNNFNFKLDIKLTSDPVLLIKTKENDITIQSMNIYFVGDNNYRVDICDIPITKYKLEQLKFVSKIYKTPEPKISLRLNPGVTREDIKQEKQIIKSKRKTNV